MAKAKPDLKAGPTDTGGRGAIFYWKPT